MSAKLIAFICEILPCFIYFCWVLKNKNTRCALNPAYTGVIERSEAKKKMDKKTRDTLISKRRTERNQFSDRKKAFVSAASAEGDTEVW